ncbi:hypothetical protein [Motilimonas sp. KMU-193]|uniref:hypothetical protein n=1 Tax=Motilimonas sp. KMU-193 TaxID=3388668 RepID=UPI00396B3D9B
MINQITHNIDSISSGYPRPKAKSNTVSAPAQTDQAIATRQTQLTNRDMETVKLAYDKPDGRNNKALASYQDIEKAQMREQISQTFGIDLYA